MENLNQQDSLVEYGFRRVVITITAVLCALLEIVDTTIVNVALNDMKGSLGATLTDVAWVITAYAIANVIVIPMTSWLSQQFGRRNYFAASIIIFTVSSFLCGNATNIWELVAFRFIQGMGGGALLVTAQTIIAESYPKEKRSMAQAIYGMGVIIGPTLGPPLGGYIIDNFSWPYIFYINVPLGIIATLLTLSFVRSPKYSQKQSAKEVDWFGMIFLIMFIGSLQFVLEHGQQDDWFDDPLILGLSILSVGWTATDAGLLLLPSSIMTGIMMPFIGKMIQNGVPQKYMVAVGLSIFFGFCFWMYSLMTNDTGAEHMFWPLILRGVGLGLLFVPVMTLSLSTLHGKSIGEGAAFTGMMRQLGGSFGIALITTFIARDSQKHRVDLVANLDPSKFDVQQRVQQLQMSFQAKGFSPNEALAKAHQILDMSVMKQATVLSYMDVFLYLGVVFLLCVPFVLMIKQGKTQIDMSSVH